VLIVVVPPTQRPRNITIGGSSELGGSANAIGHHSSWVARASQRM
jgi:hypothetical protein